MESKCGTIDFKKYYRSYENSLHEDTEIWVNIFKPICETIKIYLIQNISSHLYNTVQKKIYYKLNSYKRNTIYIPILCSEKNLTNKNYKLIYSNLKNIKSDCIYCFENLEQLLVCIENSSENERRT